MISFHLSGWNVRMLRDAGATTITTRSSRVDIAGLFNVRHPDSGHMVIPQLETNTGHHFFRRCVAVNTGQQAVAIVLAETAHLSPLAWEPISPQLA